MCDTQCGMFIRYRLRGNMSYLYRQKLRARKQLKIAVEAERARNQSNTDTQIPVMTENDADAARLHCVVASHSHTLISYRYVTRPAHFFSPYFPPLYRIA